jgi:hypothetical protein
MKVIPAFCWWQLLLKFFHFVSWRFPHLVPGILSINNPSSIVHFGEVILNDGGWGWSCGSSVHNNFDCPKCWYLRCYPKPQNVFLSKLAVNFRLLDRADVNVVSFVYDQFSPLQRFVIRREFVATEVSSVLRFSSLRFIYHVDSLRSVVGDERQGILFVLGPSVHKIQCSIVVWFVVE